MIRSVSDTLAGEYVTEVEGIGRTYAIQNTTTHNDALRGPT